MTEPNRAPPDAPEPSRPLTFLPKVRIYRLLVAGFIANVGMSFMLNLLLVMIFAMPSVDQTMSQQDVEKLLVAVSNNPWLLTALTFSDWISSMFGGFVAARMARQQELLYAAMLASANLALSFILLLSADFSSISKPLWLIVLLIGVDIWATLYGGKLAKAQRLRTETQP